MEHPLTIAASFLTLFFAAGAAHGACVTVLATEAPVTVFTSSGPITVFPGAGAITVCGVGSLTASASTESKDDAQLRVTGRLLSVTTVATESEDASGTLSLATTYLVIAEAIPGAARPRLWKLQCPETLRCEALRDSIGKPVSVRATFPGLKVGYNETATPVALAVTPLAIRGED